MNVIDWMMEEGDAVDHALAVRWHQIPDGKAGGSARMDLVREFHDRFARARIMADGMVATGILKGVAQ